jgi:hypothetical protein
MTRQREWLDTESELFCEQLRCFYDIHNTSQIFILDKKPICHLFCLANDLWQIGYIILANWHPFQDWG